MACDLIRRDDEAKEPERSSDIWIRLGASA